MSAIVDVDDSAFSGHVVGSAIQVQNLPTLTKAVTGEYVGDGIRRIAEDFPGGSGNVKRDPAVARKENDFFRETGYPFLGFLRK